MGFIPFGQVYRQVKSVKFVAQGGLNMSPGLQRIHSLELLGL